LQIGEAVDETVQRALGHVEPPLVQVSGDGIARERGRRAPTLEVTNRGCIDLRRLHLVNQSGTPEVACFAERLICRGTQRHKVGEDSVVMPFIHVVEFERSACVAQDTVLAVEFQDVATEGR
jgi:hypothetical protein